jgi:hypothetical protein
MKQLVIQKAIVVQVLASFLWTIAPAQAKTFTVGTIQQDIQASGVCIANLPNTEKSMLIIPFTSSESEPVYAWMNINGKDVRLRQTSLKIIQPKVRSIARYRANNLLVVVDCELPDAHLAVERGLLPSTTTASAVVDLSPYCFGLT